MNARFVAGSTMTETTAWTTARPKNTEAVTAWVSSSTKADTASAPTNERFVATSHGRGQVQKVKAAVTRDGRILGLKVEVIADLGAYSPSSRAMASMVRSMR